MAFHAYYWEFVFEAFDNASPSDAKANFPPVRSVIADNVRRSITPTRPQSVRMLVRNMMPDLIQSGPTTEVDPVVYTFCSYTSTNCLRNFTLTRSERCYE